MNGVMQLRWLILVGLSCAAPAMAKDTKPDTFLIEYQTFLPNLYFGLNDGPATPTLAAIQSESEWSKLWSHVEPRIARATQQNKPYPLPRIDFTRKTLIVAASGLKPSGGYSISIHSVIEDSIGISVNVIEVTPSKDCGVTLTSIYPIALVTIPKASKPVAFNITQAERTCN